MITKPDIDGEDSTPAKTDLNVSVILLAAGSSSRMGQPKQLLEVKGEPLLVGAVRSAVSCGAKEVVVVLGANEQNSRDLVSGWPVRIVSNHFWRGGMGSSIKTGLQYLISLIPETRAVILMVCDQPSLTSAHLSRLISEYNRSKKPIVASWYSGTAGVPALFSRSFFSNILMLGDDQGAKKIIDQFPENRIVVEFPEGAIDLDTVDDYNNYINQK